MFHRRKGLPDGWLPIVEARVAIWRELDDEERELMPTIADWLLRHKHWEASNGFALDDEITVTVAALAAVPVLRLGVDEYREVSAIIVYPSAMQARGTYAGPAWGTETDDVFPVLGEAHDRRGPVILAWDEARRWRVIPDAVPTSCTTSSRTRSTCSMPSSTARRRCRVAAT